MNRELTHDEAFPLLDAAALDALEPNERDAVLAHVAGCEICRPELEAFRETVSQLAFAAPLASDTASGSRERIRSRLLGRIEAEARPRDGLPLSLTQPPPPMTVTAEQRTRNRAISTLAWRRGEWVAVAASVLLVASIALLAATFRDRANLKEALDAEVARGASVRTASDSLRLALASRDSMIAGLIGRDVAVMSLTASGERAPFARMFWDTAHNTWTLVAHNMPELRAGRTYQLWLVTRTAKISAGTFTATNGDAVVRATYPLARDSLQAIAVTEEPAGGASQPTGTMIIGAEARSR